MTKKHYEAIAQAINDEIRPYDERAVSSMVYNIIDNLADYFESDNPLFQRDKFLTACGVAIQCKNKDANGNACWNCESGFDGAICGETID